MTNKSKGWLSMVLVASTAVSADMQVFERILSSSLKSPDEVFTFLVCSPEEAEARAAHVMSTVDQRLAELFAIQPENRTFDNTVRAYGELVNYFSSAHSANELLMGLSPDEQVRTVCESVSQKLQQYSVPTFNSKRVYEMFLAYEKQGKRHQESLTAEQEYVFSKMMQDFVRSGFALPDEAFAHLQNIVAQLEDLKLRHWVAIKEPAAPLRVARAELTGVDEEYVNSLVEEDGLLAVPIDHPAREAVLSYCSNSDVRQKLYEAFCNRAYPKGVQCLEGFIAKSQEFACLLGYTDYASFALEDKMAGSVARVKSFIDALSTRAALALEMEMAQLRAHAPADARFDEQGRLHAADMSYVVAHYKKKVYGYDKREVAKYFPLEQTINGLFKIYEQFLGVKFEQEVVAANAAWDPSVRMLSVRTQDTNEVLGYIVLDLFPRAFKSGHAYCQTVLSPLKRPDGTRNPALAMVLANFSVPTVPGSPTLLSMYNVTTFFHEFGHALHHVLGRTELAATSGIHVEHDFVEMPSQLFELWLTDRQILRELSSYYTNDAGHRAGEALPEELITALIESERFGMAYFVSSQAVFANMSLQCYLGQEPVDTTALWHELSARHLPCMITGEWDNGHASVMHFVLYDAQYYCYLWSEVFAHDCFEKIKAHGLRNGEIGAKFVRDILGRGGSVPASQMLRDFLGREPSTDAFFRANKI